MIPYLEIIQQHYTPGTPLYQLLLEHSTQVATLAAALSQRCTTHNIDTDFVREAAMLHDIGIYLTNAPSILCHGALPYLQHGIEGSKILDRLGLHKHALVCLRHIGAGLTANEITQQHLPLPAIDMLPLTPEEKVVCYADCFYSKSHIAPAKPLDKVKASMAKYGKGTIARLEEMITLFGNPCTLTNINNRL